MEIFLEKQSWRLLESSQSCYQVSVKWTWTENSGKSLSVKVCLTHVYEYISESIFSKFSRFVNLPVSLFRVKRFDYRDTFE